MYRLHLLGGTTLRDAQGAEVAAVVAQPKRFAVLVYLALNEGQASCRRDRLLALFWPNASQERARQALNKAVHFLRLMLGDHVIVSRGDDELAVDRGRLWCDAVAFLEVADAGRLHEALELYNGDLLPAFHADSSAAFEEWLEQQRKRLRQVAADTARSLSDKRTRDGDAAGAITLARRAFELSGDDERALRRLLQSLHAVGDRAGALHTYEAFAQHLAAAYDAEPSAETMRLVGWIRGASDAHGFNEHAEQEAVRRGANDLTGFDDQPVDDRKSSKTTQRQSVFTLRRSLLALTALTVLAVLGTVVYRTRMRQPLDPDVIAVLPFRVSASDSSFDYLREGAIDVANALLAGVGPARTIDTRTILFAWRGVSGSATADLPVPQSLTLGMRLGAAHVLLGELVATAAGHTASARVIRVRDGKVVAQHSESGSRNELGTVTRLLGRVLALHIGERPDRMAHSSDSLAAMRAYLGGLRAYRGGASGESANTLFGRALEIDPTFAAAALWRALLVGEGIAESEKAHFHAWALRDRLTTRERAILSSAWSIGPNYPDSYTSSQLIAATQRAAQLNPDRPEVWSRLGRVILNYGAASSMPDWERRAAEAADSAIVLDSNYVQALGIRWQLAIMQKDAEAERRYSHLNMSALKDPCCEQLRWIAAAVFRDSSASRRRVPDAAHFRLAISLYDLPGAVAQLGADTHLDTTRSKPRWLYRDLSSLAAFRGQVRRALAWADSALRTPTEPEQEDWLIRYAVLSHALVHNGFDSAGAANARFFRAMADTATDNQSIANSECFSELWRVARGDTSHTRRAIIRIRDAAKRLTPAPFMRVGRLDVCPLLLETQIEWHGGIPHRSPALNRLDSLMSRGVGLELPGNIANVVIARWRLMQGDYRAALAAARRRPYITISLFTDPFPAYFGEEGRAAAMVGDTAAAIRAYERFLTMRDDPDPGPVSDEVARVREHLSLLTRSSLR